MIPFISADDIHAAVSPARARQLLNAALRGGFEPSSDPARSNVSLGGGHLLLMPSELRGWAGVKVASVAPDNPAQGLPRIQAVYVLLDARTLTPRALLEGSTLTELRTPATTALAADYLAPRDAQRACVFGAGPQAIAHIIALAEVRELREIKLVGRNRNRLDTAVAKLAARDLPVSVGTPEDVADREIVITCTTADQPLFDGARIAAGAFVGAIGSHEPTSRELPSELLARSFVVVEDRATALREAGDVIIPVNEGLLDAEQLHPLDALVRGEVVRRADRPNVFKGTGMSWQDLAVAVGAFAATA